MGVGARVLKWQQLRAYARVKHPPVKIYSDPGSGLVTVDGSLRRWYWYLTWFNLHSGPGTDAYPSAGVLVARIESSPWFAGHWWYMLHRSIMTFKIPVNPPGNEIDKVTFNFYTYQVYDFLHINPSWALVQSHPFAANNLVPADYQNLDSNIISTALAYADAQQHHWYSLEILPAYLPLVQPGQILELGFREASYDIPDVEPHWTYYFASGIEIMSVDNGDPDLRPYLEVTYDP